MPAFLIPIIERLAVGMAPTLIEWGLTAIEKKYPGLRDVIEKMINAIDSSPSPMQSIKAVGDHMDTFSQYQANDVKH